ncbi:MAG: DUF2000 domain-containing protein [Oscillibacter sp.]|nr:DUF2000 domain-containing protein [Oscillibacter sp.]
MEHRKDKCVLIVDGGLPLGLAANTAAILGITIGQRHPEAVGVDVADGTGEAHLGIIETPVPVLKGEPERLKTLRQRLREAEFSEVTAVDFSDLAQSCRTYMEFQEKMQAVPEDGLQYLGLGLYGPKKLIDRLTGSLPLLR